MNRLLLLALLLPSFSSLSAQTRFDIGIAGGMQSYEASEDDPRVLTGAEVMVSRGRLGLYYALEYADLSFAGAMYANHGGVMYRWPLGGKVSFLAGAGPSYVSVESLGGETTFHAQVELAIRTGRLEWFAKVRQYDYSMSEFRIATASPSGPAVMAGVRFSKE